MWIIEGLSTRMDTTIQTSPIKQAVQRHPEWKQRSLAALLHVAITAALLTVVLWTVVSHWYPAEYRGVAGGWSLLMLVLSVDLCLGPLMTWAVFDVRKPRDMLLRDLSIVGALQVAALIFGLSVAAESRPVGLVFSVDRFDLVAANGLRQQELPFVSPELRRLSWHGPKLYATRDSEPTEVLDAVSLAGQGYDLAQRPSYWVPYARLQATASAKSKPVSMLLTKHGMTREEFCERFREIPCSGEKISYLPLQARAGDGAVLLDDQGVVLGVVPLDGF